MKKKITADHFAAYRMLSCLKEDKGILYFVISQADIEENCYKKDLYRLKDGKITRLTCNGKTGSYELLNGNVIFQSIREKKDQETVDKGLPLTVWYRLTEEMGEAQEWKRLPYKVFETAWIDEDHFFFTAEYSRHWQELLKACGGDTEAALKKKEEQSEVRVFDELPFWSNGGGDISGLRRRLYYYSEGRIICLCSPKMSVFGLTLDPSKKELVFFASEYDAKAPLSNRLMSVDCSRAEEAVKTFFEKTLSDPNKETEAGSLLQEHKLFENARGEGISFREDGLAVLRIDRMETYGLNENDRFYLWNREDDSVSEIYSGEFYEYSASEGSDIKMGNHFAGLIFEDEGFTMISTVENHMPLVHISFDGTVKELTGEEAVLEAIPAEDGYYAIAMKEMSGTEIYRIKKDGSFEALTSFNRSLREDYEVCLPIEMSFVNENGLTIKGYVLPPAGKEEGKKYPVILDIHGGPKTVYGPHYFHEMQYWANEGFAVIFTNPTGSDGRGNEFMDIRGKYGSVDYRDLMTFVDEVLARFDFLDADRLGVTGGSYGGFMTNWIIGHTDRFRAAASQRSISNWVSFSNTSDIGYYFGEDQQSADSWNGEAQLWDHSPLKYADRAKTPTLFLHSDEDTRCWMEGGIQMYCALKNFNVPSKLLLFHAETHELSRSGRPKSRIRRNEEICEWMKKYV